MSYLRLGVNIDHVATIRNARGGKYPSPIEAAIVAQNEGADVITAHLREDRRHVSEYDIKMLREKIKVPLNLEMAAIDEMVDIALSILPDRVCFVPEKRKEITTEGGLNLNFAEEKLKVYIKKLKQLGIKISLFIEPSIDAIKIAHKLGADIVELHTGKYSNLSQNNRNIELEKIKLAAKYADECKIEVHAGHGLDYYNVIDIAKIKEIKELNIGHFIIGQSIFDGLGEVVKKMLNIINQQR